MAALQGYIEDEATKRANEIISKRMDELVAEKLIGMDGMLFV